MQYIVRKRTPSSRLRPAPHRVHTAATKPAKGSKVTMSTSRRWNRAVLGSKSFTPGTEGWSLATRLSSKTVLTCDLPRSFGYVSVTYRGVASVVKRGVKRVFSRFAERVARQEGDSMPRYIVAIATVRAMGFVGGSGGVRSVRRDLCRTWKGR
jgi:hypothetical protein